MIQSLLSRFVSHLFFQLKTTFGSQKKETRNGFKWLIYTSSILCRSAMLFLKSSHSNSEPVLVRLLPGLFPLLRAELMEYICTLNPRRHFHDEGTTVKKWSSRWVSKKTKELSGMLSGTGAELAAPQLWDPTHDTVVKTKINKSVRGKGTWYWCPKLNDIIGNSTKWIRSRNQPD